MSERVTRRCALSMGAGTAALPLAQIRTTGAAGKLSLAICDHWVPAANARAAGAQAKSGHDIYAFNIWTVHKFADSSIRWTTW